MKKTRRKVTKRYQKGSLSTGAGFVILGLLALIAVGGMMVGDITPISRNKNTSKVTLITITPEPSKPNLQLQTFPGITSTPTPTPTLEPQPNETGGFNYGEAPGGSSSPGGGGGANSGSAI